ncbi:MAG: transposase [Candidatus Promineofilum sp.]|nr:transposase [Promineifilum sp.]MCW5862369.1 transposase [Anaerolineae bacterium]
MRTPLGVWSQPSSTPNRTFAFRAEGCLPCPMRQRCSRAKTGHRTLTICPQEQSVTVEELMNRVAEQRVVSEQPPSLELESAPTD